MPKLVQWGWWATRVRSREFQPMMLGDLQQ
jgi:hypothetical protein